MKSQKGFSLLEVIISMLILAVGLLGVAGLMTVGIRTNADAAHLTEAYQIGQEEMERLKTVSWSSIVGTDFTTRELRGITFTSTWRVVSTVGRIKDVNLAVTWNEGLQNQIEHKIDLRTKLTL